MKVLDNVIEDYKVKDGNSICDDKCRKIIKKDNENNDENSNESSDSKNSIK